MAKRSLSNYGVPYQELGNEEIKRFILAFLIAIMVYTYTNRPKYLSYGPHCASTVWASLLIESLRKFCLLFFQIAQGLLRRGHPSSIFQETSSPTTNLYSLRLLDKAAPAMSRLICLSR